MTALSPSALAALERLALANGDMRALMHRTQLIALERFDATKSKTFSIDCSRRWGKTVYSALLTYRQALRKPGSIVRYVAPTKTHGRQFVQPTFAWVDSRLPERFRPRFDRQDNTWHWPNGARCHLGSAETMQDVEVQVGTGCDLAILDEAGKIRSELLKHLHLSVLLPQFLTTGGRCIVPSTPAISPAHYLTEIVARAQAENAMVRFTIDDCDHVPKDEIDALIAELGGPSSTNVRRELYCEHVAERSRLIVPEWIDVRDECVAESPVPDFRDWYVAADFGFEDLTVILWAWYDFAKAQLVIERELAMHQASGIDVGIAARAIEAELGITKAFRVADAPTQLLADLMHPMHGPGIAFAPAIKDDADAAMNQLRMLIQKKRIRVHPRCRTLISHLNYGTWNERRTSFDREPGFGHWDAIDALKYLSRIVDWKRNPIPADFGISPFTHQTHFVPKNSAADSFKRAMGRY